MTGAVFVIRKFFELSFSKDLESFKGELEKESIKFRTSFERLHEEQARAIKETFQHIVDTQRAFESLMNPMQLVGEPAPEEKAREAANQFNELSLFFHRNEVFFDDGLAKEANEFVDKLQEVWKKFTKRKFLPDGQPVRDLDNWNKAWEALQKDIPDLKAKLTHKFRSLIDPQ